MVTQVDVGNGRGWLAPPAAASLKRLDRQLGHAMQTTELGRTWARQYEHWLTYQRYGNPIALHPNTPSIHQLGFAMDTDEGQRHVALLNENGWKQTVYRNGKLIEPWHFEYDASRDKHINDPLPTPSVPKEEDTMQSVRTPNGKIYGMGVGSIVHFSRLSEAKITTAVNSATDETHNLSLAEFVDLLDGMLIPRNAVDASGNVLNPETGKYEVGGAWSWSRVNKAANDRIEKKLNELLALTDEK